jgi:hypothetical protein
MCVLLLHNLQSGILPARRHLGKNWQTADGKQRLGVWVDRLLEARTSKFVALAAGPISGCVALYQTFLWPKEAGRARVMILIITIEHRFRL